MPPPSPHFNTTQTGGLKVSTNLTCISLLTRWLLRSPRGRAHDTSAIDFVTLITREPLPAPGNRSNERQYKEKDLARTEEERSERGKRESGGEETWGCEK
ncbi:hypothetical protein TNCV_2319091 [Trichonephila clavipes]|nr:hypothetical protein TNCV_2319091 [Trichonephila clavipes]